VASPTEIETMGQLIRAIDAMGESEIDQLFFKLPMEGGARVNNHLTALYGRAKLELDALAWVKSLPLALGNTECTKDPRIIIDTEIGQMIVNRCMLGPEGALQEISGFVSDRGSDEGRSDDDMKCLSILDRLIYHMFCIIDTVRSRLGI
jgi:hypothetical protein